MKNNSMPRSKTSIKLPFSTMDEAGDAWPMLVVFLRIASEHPYGIVPDEFMSIQRASNVFAAPLDEIRRQAAFLSSSGLVSYVDMPVEKKGNGWSRGSVVSGWYCSSWPQVCNDSRRVKRDHIVPRDGVVLFGAVIPAASQESELKRLENKALECMKVGGRRGRVLALDAISVRWLVSLNEEYGFDIVSKALEDSAGADRPVAMARKILTRKSRGGGGSVPSADEWRKG